MESTGSSTQANAMPEYQKTLIHKINQKHAAIEAKKEDQNKSVSSIKELSGLVLKYVGKDIYQGCEKDKVFTEQVGSDSFKAKYLNHSIPAVQELAREKENHFKIGEEIKKMEAEVKQLEEDKENNTLLPAELFRLIENLKMEVKTSKQEADASKREAGALKTEIDALKARNVTAIPYLSVVPTASTGAGGFVNWNGVTSLTASHFRVEPADKTTITILVPGVYQITARMGQVANTSNSAVVSIIKNGTTIAISYNSDANGYYNGGEITDLVPLVLNDKIKIQYNGNSTCYAPQTKLMMTYINSS